MPEIAAPGWNCWTKARADRAAFLVDAASYFKAFSEAVKRARHSILIVGWDIDSRLKLVREGDDFPDRLADFLNAVVASRSSLRAHILIWDYAIIYALEREPLPVVKLDWSTHRRIDFRLDSRHPVGASHHQKIVVIDDRIAFVGGIDLTARRWDTSDHKAKNPQRVDPSNEHYTPYHDVQMAVSGPAARAMGDLVRERWSRATGKSIQPPPESADDPWPSFLEPDLENLQVAIARTDPENPAGMIREIERLHLDAIANAGEYIYIENQYLTSATIGDAIASRLQEDDGPEIIIIGPREESGWLEQSSMGLMRAHFLEKLERADRFGRLRAFYPVAPDDNSVPVFVHAKVFVADDEIARVGSANLSNRSMGLDTECDLMVEARGDDKVRAGIASFRDRLLAEHLKVSPARLREDIQEKGSLVKAMDLIREQTGGVEPIREEVPEWVAEMVPDTIFFDPEEPVDLDELADTLMLSDFQAPGRLKKVAWGAIFLVVLAGLAILWRWTPLGQWADPEMLAAWAGPALSSPWAPLYTILVYVAGGVMVFPVTVLILATGMVFSPLKALVYAFLGSLISASIIYWAGRVLGKEVVHRIAGRGLERIRNRIAKRGFTAVVVLRVVPVAPFTVINLVAGVSRIRFRDYLLATLMGMAPGIVAMTVFGDRLEKTIQDPQPQNVAILIALLALIVLASILVRQRLARPARE